MKLNVFKSYGVLAHEKNPVYTGGRPASDIYDVVAVDIPESFPVWQNEAGSYIVTIDGEAYDLNEVLSNRGDRPVLSWYDGRSYRTVYLDK